MRLLRLAGLVGAGAGGFTLAKLLLALDRGVSLARAYRFSGSICVQLVHREVLKLFDFVCFEDFTEEAAFRGF